MPVIFIEILNFNIFKSKNPVSHHLILNTQTYEQEIKNQEFHFIELTKFVKKEDELETIVDKWLYLLKNAGDFDEVPKKLKNPEELNEALDILSTHQWSVRELEVYDKEMDRARVEISIMETEKEEREKFRQEVAMETAIEERKAIAKSMQAKGIDVKTIADVTKLRIDEIKSLK
jgi:predicted transposase/invertase (TIGR01784 family)